MVRSFFLSILLVIPGNMLAQSGKETFSDPVEFNDILVLTSAEVTQGIIQLTSLAFESDPLLLLEEISELNRSSIKRLKNVEPVKGGERFLKAIISLLEFYEEQLNNDWKNAMKLLSEADEETSEDEINRIVGLMNNYVDHEADYLDECELSQKDFAATLNIQLDREVPDE